MLRSKNTVRSRLPFHFNWPVKYLYTTESKVKQYSIQYTPSPPGKISNTHQRARWNTRERELMGPKDPKTGEKYLFTQGI